MHLSRLRSFCHDGLLWIKANRSILALSIGLGAILTMYITYQLRPILTIDLDELLATAPQELEALYNVNTIESALVWISIFSLFVVPSLWDSKSNAFQRLVLLIFLFIDFILILQVIFLQVISNFFVAILALSCTYYVWYLGESLKRLARWLYINVKLGEQG